MKNVKGTDFELKGYEISFINRQNKGGGGVAIYKTLYFKVIEKLTTVADNLLECITVETRRGKHKHTQ